MRVPAVPKKPLGFSFACFALAPAAARIPAALLDPADWRLVGMVALMGLMISAAPGMVALGAAQANRDRPLVYWFALSAGLGVQLWFFAQLALPRGDHPGVGFAMIIIALLSSVAILVGWLVAALAHRYVKPK